MLKLLWILLLGAWCRHSWVLVSDKEFPSPLETWKLNGCGYPVPFGEDRRERMAMRTYVAVVRCDKCGAIKTFKETA